MQSPKRQRNQRGEGARLKDELVEAAMRILDRQPGVSLSLRMVAKEAGISAPSVYMQFPDAQSMLREIVHECWRQMAASMQDTLRGIDPPSLFDRLVASVEAYVRYAMARPSRYQLLFDMHGVSAMDFDGPVQPVFRVIAEPVEQMERDGKTLPLTDPFLTTLLVLSMVHGRVALAHTAPVRPGNASRSVEHFARMSLEQLFGLKTSLPRLK